jgi:hypothetical protein
MKIEWAELLVMSEFDDCVLCPVEEMMAGSTEGEGCQAINRPAGASNPKSFSTAK